MQVENHTLEKASVMESYMKKSEPFRHLQQRFSQGKVNHGYLFTGAKGAGKYALAILTAQMLFCTEKDKPCGKCGGCLKVKHHTHPDVTQVKAEPSIGVEQIRRVVSKTGEHAYEGGYQVVMIQDAEKMTIQAQNALLKTLEEPYANIVFLLLTSEKSLLLPTILSRVQIVPLPQATNQEMVDFLAQTNCSPQLQTQVAHLARGRLGQALAYTQDGQLLTYRADLIEKVLSISSFYEVLTASALYKDQKQDDELFFELFEEVVHIALFVTLKLYPLEALEGYPASWKKMTEHSSSAKFFVALLDKIGIAKEKRMSRVTWQAVLEELFKFIMEENQKWQQ